MALPDYASAINKTLCEALGLDPSITLAITLEFHASELPSAWVHQRVDDTRMERIARILKLASWTDALQEQATETGQGGEVET